MLPNVILFNGKSAGNNGLWETNGSLGGTFAISPIIGAAVFPGLAINPQNTDVLDLPFAVSNALVNGQVVFNGKDAGASEDLWETDGTTDGTFQLTATAADVSPADITAYNGGALFNGNFGWLEPIMGDQWHSPWNA